MRDVLQVRGYRTVEAETAEEGLAPGPRRARPALILMDIQLPGMNGIEALGQSAGRRRHPRHPGDRGHRLGHGP